MDSAGSAGKHSKPSTRATLRDLFEVVAVNDLAPPETLATLLTYDSTYGRFNAEIAASDKSLTVNGKEIAVFAEKQPRKIPWKSSRSISSSSRPASSRMLTMPKRISRQGRARS